MSASHITVVVPNADRTLLDSDPLGDRITVYVHTLFGASMADFALQEEL